MHVVPTDAEDLIPSAPFDDLDLETEAGEEEWERRVMTMARRRLELARERLERMGIIDANGQVVSTELPPDMLDDSESSTDTG